VGTRRPPGHCNGRGRGTRRRGDEAHHTVRVADRTSTFGSRMRPPLNYLGTNALPSAQMSQAARDLNNARVGAHWTGTSTGDVLGGAWNDRRVPRYSAHCFSQRALCKTATRRLRAEGPNCESRLPRLAECAPAGLLRGRTRSGRRPPRWAGCPSGRIGRVMCACVHILQVRGWWPRVVTGSGFRPRPRQAACCR
jgi:hypothetical protein